MLYLLYIGVCMGAPQKLNCTVADIMFERAIYTESENCKAPLTELSQWYARAARNPKSDMMIMDVVCVQTNQIRVKG